MSQRVAPEIIGRYDWKGSAVPVNGAGQSFAKAYDKVMINYLREVGAPGGALTVFFRGKRVYSKGFGYAGIDAKIPFTPSTPTRISSVSKYLTKAAIDVLINRGLLHADDHIVDILLRGGVIASAPVGKPVDARVSQVTIQQLIDHKSGIEQGLDISQCTNSTVIRSMDFSTPISAENALSYVLGRPLQSMPGTEELYSNYGYALLGKIVQIVSGETYEKFVRENVLLPSHDRNRWFVTTAQRKDKRPIEAEYYSHAQFRSWDAFHWDIMAGAGGWVAPVDGLAELFATKFPGVEWGLVYFGSYTGAVTVMKVHKTSLTFAASINYRRGNDANDNDVLFAALEKVTVKLKLPPVH